MMNLKAIRYLTFALFLLFLGMSHGEAIIDDDCVANNTCIVVCNYVNSYKASGSHATGYQQPTSYRDITIYYMLGTNEFKVKWQTTHTEPSTYEKGPGTLRYIFSNDDNNIYGGYGQSPSIDTFVCPANGYLDMNSFNGNNELCFDMDGVACSEDNSGFGTTFGKGNSFISQEKNYDFEDQIRNYRDNIFSDIINEISSGEFDPETNMEEKVINDFQTNFLYGYDVPPFIINSAAYAYLTEVEELQSAYNEARDEALANAEEDLAAGVITQEEYDEIVANWDNDVNAVVENVQAGFEKLGVASSANLDFYTDTSCESYLGVITDHNDPAYYLNFVFQLMKYAAIVLLLVLTTVDVIKTMSTKTDDLKDKVIKKVVKRFIIVVIIFFLPELVNFILDLLGIISTDPTCGIS